MKKYMPYSIDLKYHYRTYKNIGKLYQKEWRKKTHCDKKRNNKKRYKNFDTFSQWEQWVFQEFYSNKIINTKDIIHYLKSYKRKYEQLVEMVGGIVIPLYVVLLTMGMTLLLNTDIIQNDAENMCMVNEYIMHGYFEMSGIILLVLLFLMINFYNNKRKLYFYTDLIKILKKKHPTANKDGGASATVDKIMDYKIS